MPVSFSQVDLLKLRERFLELGPGVLIALLIAIAAKFLSDHYGAPAMLLALLLGFAFHFLSEEGRCKYGIAFASRSVLRFGVALLGARISIDLLLGLGVELIALVFAAVGLTIAFGFLGARLLGRGWRFAVLTGGSVAICGASAAIAIAAVLPKNEHSERNLTFTVIAVTVLSTLAMILYPPIAQFFGFDDSAIGVFLGATIHDVAQVVGAGFSISDNAGETATLVKLIRVTLLAPVVLLLSVSIRALIPYGESASANAPLIPLFVVAFLVLAGVNSAGAIPTIVSRAIADLSRWSLLVAIAAVGMKTELKTILNVGRQAITLIVAETLFIAGFVLLGLKVLGG